MSKSEEYREIIKTLKTSEILSLIDRKYSFETWLMEAVKELQIRTQYENPKPVVVVMIPSEGGGLLLIRRADSNLLALPGGYQNLGETWQEAAIREVKEETGLEIWRPKLVHVITVHGHNLMFCEVQPMEIDLTLSHDSEVVELKIVTEAPKHEEVAFPAHKLMIDEFFGGIN